MPRRRVAAHLAPVDCSTLPVYDWGSVPEGLATKRQLAADALRPGGQPVVGIVRCRRCLPHPKRECRIAGHLYRRDLAKPKRVPTLAQEEALDKAMAARQTCIQCQVRQPYCVRLDTHTCAACTARAEMETAA